MIIAMESWSSFRQGVHENLATFRHQFVFRETVKTSSEASFRWCQPGSKDLLQVLKINFSSTPQRSEAAVVTTFHKLLNRLCDF